MDTGLTVFPYGYEAELADQSPCYRKLTPYGWEVHRQYLLYDGRPGSDLLAVYPTEQDAVQCEAWVAQAIAARADRQG